MLLLAECSKDVLFPVRYFHHSDTANQDAYPWTFSNHNLVHWVGLAGVFYCPGLQSFVHSPFPGGAARHASEVSGSTAEGTEDMDSNRSLERSDFTAC